MKCTPANKYPLSVKPLEPGDFVTVYLSPVGQGFIGFLTQVRPDCLRMVAHQPTKDHLVEEGDCLNWDLVIPMTSVLFVRQMPGQPVTCSCREVTL